MAIAMRNYPEYCVAVEAILAIGAVAVTLNSWWQQDELEYGLRDSGARFAFVAPALSADQTVRDEFFESLRDAGNREREPWVLEAVGHLHHPLRAEASEAYIRPSLELLEEIQRTDPADDEPLH